MIGHETLRTTAENYRRFATREARGKSPLYEELTSRLADDDEVLALIDSLPPAKRQPNLVLGAARLLYGTCCSYQEFRRLLVEGWADVRSVVLARATQTNEVGRCAALMPLLAELPQPVALLEVGASAGLCLLPDRYRYRYQPERGPDRQLGPPQSPVTLTCELRGDTEPPTGLPQVAWRAGLDLDPVDITDPDAVRWLETLVWPGQTERLQRLRAAIALAAADPPVVARGDLRTDLATLAGEAPPHATLVIFHSAVLAYLPPEDRASFAEHVSALDAVWVANEAPGVLAAEDGLPAAPTDATSAFMISRDGQPVAWTDPHGAWLRRL